MKQGAHYKVSVIEFFKSSCDFCFIKEQNAIRFAMNKAKELGCGEFKEAGMPGSRWMQADGKGARVTYGKLIIIDDYEDGE